jgi:hypothetical protein
MAKQLVKVAAVLLLAAGCLTQEDVDAAYQRGVEAGNAEANLAAIQDITAARTETTAVESKLAQCQADLEKANAKPKGPPKAWNVVLVRGTCDVWYKHMTLNQCEAKRDKLNAKHGPSFMCWHNRAIREGGLKTCRKDGGMIPL